MGQMFKVPNISSIDEYQDNVKFVKKKKFMIINKYASHHFGYSFLRKKFDTYSIFFFKLNGSDLSILTC